MTPRWIATGLSQDLPKTVVMAGHWQGHDLAVWRSATGRLQAWNDRCPHRGMRLSHGFVRGETLACIYHGWVYGADGGCKHIPAHPALIPPATITVARFACVEQDGVIWVAPADILGAPPALIGLQPLRSISLTCDVAAVVTAEPALQGQDILRATVQMGGQGQQVCLVAQDGPAGLTLHALCGVGADKVAASRWVEDLRRRAEMKVAA
jgi:nitrite reductase/ring-hydroxylating ferredoxin subunit